MKVQTKWFLYGLTGSLALALPAFAAPITVVNDSWADGGRDNGADPLDSNWWTSAASAGIEVSTGMLGMVTGTSGRGIHTVFPTQTLSNIGDSLTATYTFTTPTTIGTGQTGGFRVGLFDTLGRAGLDGDIAASTGTPNSLYGFFGTNTPGLPGYMMDMDVGTGAEDLSFRQLDPAVTATTPTGRLLGTATGFTQISPTGPDGVYTFAPNTSYTGSMTLLRISATELEISGSLGAATHSVTDVFDSTSYGMLAFWANSNVFGSVSTPGSANNGIDFTNVTITFTPVPEPGTAALLLAVSGAMLRRQRPTR
ncbi:MAG TPA: PEP-CTERM sorting domain-containing protein [Tepidisphaeraceae bacterium]|nr:PEP-CTERM sorting domain-containing protein [Tepidisphaeraceae bacterium]